MASDPSQLLQALLQPGGITGGSFTQGLQNAQQQQLAPLQVQGAQQGLQLGQQQIAANDAAAQQAQAYQSWKNAYAANPTAKMLGMGIASFPEHAKAIKDSYDALNQDAQQSRTLQFNQLYNAAKNGSPDLVAKNLTNIISAEKSAGMDTSDLDQIQQRVSSGDPDALRDVLATAQAHLAITNPDFAKAIGVTDHTNHYSQLGSGGIFDEQTGQIVKSPDDKPDKPDWIYDSTNQRWLLKPGTGGGDPSSGGGAVGSGSDTSRLINSDAGGGQVPASVQTLGQFVGFGKALNARGAKSSSAGTYQINGTTMSEFGPKALGPNWKSAPFNADTQDKVGEAIFNWAKTQPNPAQALARRWVSLTPAKAAQLVGGSWNQAKGVIAQGETGGGAGASASAPQGSLASGGMSQPGVISVPAGGNAMVPGNPDLQGPEYLADLRSKNAPLANQVQAVLDTRAALPPATARSQAAQQLRAAVTQAEPGFDDQAYARRKTTIQQYTPGHTGPGASMLSAATLINHMYDMAQAAQKLPDHTFAFQNRISNAAAGATNQPYLIKYNEGRKFVSTELPKFLSGKAPTQGETEHSFASYDPSLGASGIKTALGTDIDYLYGRYQPLVQAYKDSTGKDLNLENYAPGKQTTAKAAALQYYQQNGALPAIVTSPAQARALPHGAAFVTPDGRVKYR